MIDGIAYNFRDVFGTMLDRQKEKAMIRYAYLTRQLSEKYNTRRRRRARAVKAKRIYDLYFRKYVFVTVQPKAKYVKTMNAIVEGLEGK